ncbi:MAG: hypothetical protein IJS61_10225 [Firmicutes bacterium]|nr:hypothetical protein [Bacillota bacterium]
MIVIRFYKTILSDKNTDTEKYIDFLHQGIAVRELYIIKVPYSSSNLMDILSSKDFLKKVNSFSEKDTVIGLAKSKKSAIQLSKRIIENYLVDHDDLNGFKDKYLR